MLYSCAIISCRLDFASWIWYSLKEGRLMTLLESGAMEEKNVSVSELRTHLSHYLRQVERGEVILITKRGKPLGYIVPANLPLKEKLDALAKAGFLYWGGKELTPWEPVAENKGPGLVSDLVR
jgi:prevent-host-death family protein